MKFQTVKNLKVDKSKVIGIINGDGFFYPDHFYTTQDNADAGMLSLALSEISRVNNFYDSRRKVNEDGSLAKPGRRSDADMLTVNVAEGWVAKLEAAHEEREVIARFKATLTPEQLAVLEG